MSLQLNDKFLTTHTDYTVSFYNNKAVGKAIAVFTGIGKYNGTLSKAFNILPKTTKLSKIVKKKKGFTAKWKKSSSANASGYQVRYSLKSSMKSAISKKVKGVSKSSLTIKKLKSKKKYYVQVRVYKTVKGKSYYSVWSAKKSVTTK